jgi:hypothetical protein
MLLTLFAGSGTAPGVADPAAVWGYLLSNGKTAGQNLAEVNTWLYELHLIHGLRAGSPLSVTATARTAGAVAQTIMEAAGVVTVARTGAPPPTTPEKGIVTENGDFLITEGGDFLVYES